ncbi:phosphatase PAP2 family protein [Micromonospora sp. ATA32]|nr:phosphatase PAP2 family protein [Micromonospora sp. ATA32]
MPPLASATSAARPPAAFICPSCTPAYRRPPSPRRKDMMNERLFMEINDFARTTPWLHAALSGYAVYGVVLFAGLLLVSWRLGLLAVVAAALMGFARVYIAAHYPYDVLAGFAVGAAVTLLGYLLARRPLAAGLRRLEHTRFRSLLRPSTGDAVADEYAPALDYR